MKKALVAACVIAALFGALLFAQGSTETLEQTLTIAATCGGNLSKNTLSFGTLTAGSDSDNNGANASSLGRSVRQRT